MSRPVQQPAGAINAQRETITRYAPDPRGGSMLAGLLRATTTALDGQDGYVYTGDKGSAETSFNGDYNHPSGRGFTGAAALSLWGTVRPNTAGDASTQALVAMQELTDDPGLRIFAARASRQGAL